MSEANAVSNNNGNVWTQALLLCLVNLINYMDRYTVSGVLEAVEKDFNMTKEWQGGLLQTAFIICYFASAPMFGYLGDRYSRKYLMIFGILAWTACTLASSFMQDYTSFCVMRSLIGFGEAGFSVIAPTVLSDMFNDSRLSMVLAMFYYSIPVGSGLGYMIGSQIAILADDWRWGVRYTPFLTIIAVIFLIIFLKDHPRGTQSQYEVNLDGLSFGAKIKSYLDDLVYLIFNKTFVFVTIGFTALCFTTGALAWWGNHLIIDAIVLRNETQTPGFDSDPSEEDVAFLFGVIMSIAGVVGLTVGSGLSYWLRPKYKWIDPVLCGGGLLISSPIIFTCMYICKDSLIPAMVLLCIGQTFLNMNWAVSVDIALYVVVPTRRATGQAINLICAHAIGEAGSPYLVGLITDAFHNHYQGANSTYVPGDPMSDAEKDFLSLQWGCYVTVILEFASALFFLMGALTVTKDWTKAQKEEEDLACLNSSVDNHHPDYADQSRHEKKM